MTSLPVFLMAARTSSYGSEVMTSTVWFSNEISIFLFSSFFDRTLLIALEQPEQLILTSNK